ncbi:MAG: hypothetical protein ACI9LO_001257 [Planctomycetota bacterium]|jgi:hypothetical protein
MCRNLFTFSSQLDTADVLSSVMHADSRQVQAKAYKIFEGKDA